MTPLSTNPLKSRDDVACAVRDLYAPLIPYTSPGGARVTLSPAAAHFDRAAADLEGFARPLWGLAPLAAGGGSFAHWDSFRRGLANGTDPDHPEYWGDVGDMDQRQVELAAIGFALALAKPQLWDPLDARAKANIAAYLTAARNRNYVDNNWKFFRILTDIGLKNCGTKTDRAGHESYLDDLEGFYLGDGWYRDGPQRSAEHYIPFAFHFYGLITAVLGDDPARAGTYRSRARNFAEEMRHWYAPDGSALPFGRSLTYRFAHAGFWGALAYADVEALPWGEIKGYYLRNLRWWAKQPIFDRDGVLSIGYAYPNLLVSESYNSAGSPYWAMKAFLPLALPETHPFWQADEAPAPKLSSPAPLPRPGMVAQHLDGHIVALSAGQEHIQWRGGPEKYAKFAYSTRYGFSVEADERHFDWAAMDNMLGLSDDGLHFRVRESNDAVMIAGTTLYARWHPWEDVEVETWLVPQDPWHLRLHRITTPRKLQLIEGGFAVARPDFGKWQEQVSDANGQVISGNDISAIHGFDSRRARIAKPLPNTNLMVAKTLVPQLIGELAPGSHTLSCAVLAGLNSTGLLQALNTLPAAPDEEALRLRIATEGASIDVFELKARPRG
ncbi:MAG: DUF2264 domain-containing protein [Maritimibacter sp.]